MAILEFNVSVTVQHLWRFVTAWQHGSRLGITIFHIDSLQDSFGGVVGLVKEDATVGHLYLNAEVHLRIMSHLDVKHTLELLDEHIHLVLG